MTWKKTATRHVFWMIFVALIWISTIILFARNNLDNQNFWFDESGQFWMAKGLAHYSLPNEPVGNVRQVLVQNALSNLDPGGFTIILHFWSMFSSQPIFLRLLPFIFFVLSMIMVSRLCLLWLPKKSIS